MSLDVLSLYSVPGLGVSVFVVALMTPAVMHFPGVMYMVFSRSGFQ